MDIHKTYLEINLRALEQNYRFLRSQLLPTTKFLAVVKANSYGSEATTIALRLQDLGADYFAVAYADEGISLRKAGIVKPIIVFHPLIGNLQRLIAYNLEPTLYCQTVLNCFLNVVQSSNLENYPVHIKFNTGLNRLGFDVDQANDVLIKIASLPQLKLMSIYSHLAASEDAQERDFTKHQIAQFTSVVSLAKTLVNYPFLSHLLNTSGILNYPEAQFDMVRSGIGLYGFGNAIAYRESLIPISTLKTVISQLHHLKTGDFLGYNKSHRATKDSVTATLPIGHADGLNRIYGKRRGFVFINGKKAPIIGNTCMDMIMVDVTGIACKEGDEVIIFGTEHSAEDMAAEAGTIAYELITSISTRVSRKIV